MSDPADQGDKRREDAAKAAWLYFIGGRTQDDIARQLDLSRQAVQRLVSFAVSEKLIKFRMDHPIASCMAVASQVADRFALEFCDVIPTDRTSPGSVNRRHRRRDRSSLEQAFGLQGADHHRGRHRANAARGC